MREGIIRPLALAIIIHQNKILVMDGYDPKKKKKFYRLLGGGIERGEYGRDALSREFMEELAVGLREIEYVATLENIFTFDGNLGHEIVLVYRAILDSEELINEESIPILDSKEGHKAWWINIDLFKDKKEILYPDGILEFI